MPAELLLPPVGLELPDIEQLLANVDFSAWSNDQPKYDFLKPFVEQATVAQSKFKPLTVDERLEALARMGFIPHGHFEPSDPAMRKIAVARLKEIGDMENDSARLVAYTQHQRESLVWFANGVPGNWTGQQMVVRSAARFRIVAAGRRWGKSQLAAHEILAVALTRPRSWVWCVGPTMKLADRMFEMVADKLRDMGLLDTALIYRNTSQEKLIMLENRSKIEGISAENYMSMAGASVDFAVIDECAQIYPEAWFRGVLPPLSDKQGGALLISSLEGDGDFFTTQFKRAERARQEAVERGEDPDEIEWDFFRSESWLNFFAFPQGRSSRSIRTNELNTPPQDFLEQYGAVLQGARDAVFPEFRMSVHAGHYPYDPNLPVTVTADPSGGSNPYALGILQEHPELPGNPVWLVDEVYETGMTVQDLHSHIERRPWVKNIKRFILDSAPGSTQDLLEWSQLGYPSEAVYKKPPIWERLPLFRNLLRDPGIFYQLRQMKMAAILASLGVEPDTPEQDLSINDQQMVLIQLEEMLDDARLTEDDRQRLRNCSHFFVDQGCINFLQEIRSYRYNRKRQINLNMREVPRDYANHLMDALGYYVWQCRRVAGTGESMDFQTVMATTVPIPLNVPLDMREVVDVAPVQGGFLASMRARYDHTNTRDFTTLKNG